MQMNNKLILSTKNDKYTDGTGFKVVEINVADRTENLYAVVTPVKIK